MTCDGLPDPGSLSDMNTFLFLWPLTDKEASMNTIEDKCRVITHLLSKIDRIIRFSTIDSKEYVIECESIATKLRIELQRWIDLACYRLLRNIEANMIREDMKTTRYVRATNKAVCCVWAPIPLPIGLKRQGGDIERSSLTAHGKSIEIEFKEMKLTIKMPSDLDCHRMAIRGLWLAYDHYSIEANSYRMPQLPENLFDLWNPSLDLLEYSTREYEEKVRLREEQAEGRRLRLEEKKAILERMEYPPVSPRLDKRRKRGKKEKKAHSAKDYQLEFESTLASVLPSKTELLPYLPTPNEILDQKEGKIVVRFSNGRCHIVSHGKCFVRRGSNVGKQKVTLYSMRKDRGEFAKIQDSRWSISRRSPLSTTTTKRSRKRDLFNYS